MSLVLGGPVEGGRSLPHGVGTHQPRPFLFGRSEGVIQEQTERVAVGADHHANVVLGLIIGESRSMFADTRLE
jgi:hypothetical protein